MYPPVPRPADIAIFLDFDGTLVTLAAAPDAVHVPAGLPVLLQALSRATGGALAVITGRSLASLDNLLQWPVDAAGSHGAEWRNRGNTERSEAETGPLDRMRNIIAGFAEEHRLQLEDKHQGMALHFRGSEHLEPRIDTWLSQRVDPQPGLEVTRGKCVREVRLEGTNKGTAIERFMGRAPFAGRTPYFIGDDVTDEDGFAWVNASGGVSVKVGDGETRAGYRLEDCLAVHRWLQALLQQGEAKCNNGI